MVEDLRTSHRLNIGRGGDFVVEVRHPTRNLWRDFAYGSSVSGVLKTEIDADIARKDGFVAANGAIAFELLLRAALERGPIHAILGHWFPDSVNYRVYNNGLAKGLTKVEAALDTWTGGQAKHWGFGREVRVDDSDAFHVRVLFMQESHDDQTGT